MPRTARDVVFVDGVRTPFGKAGPKGIYAETRADDLIIKCIRELVRRTPSLPPELQDPEAASLAVGPLPVDSPASPPPTRGRWLRTLPAAGLTPSRQGP